MLCLCGGHPAPGAAAGRTHSTHSGGAPARARPGAGACLGQAWCDHPEQCASVAVLMQICDTSMSSVYRPMRPARGLHRGTQAAPTDQCPQGGRAQPGTAGRGRRCGAIDGRALGAGRDLPAAVGPATTGAGPRHLEPGFGRTAAIHRRAGHCGTGGTAGRGGGGAVTQGLHGCRRGACSVATVR